VKQKAVKKWVWSKGALKSLGFYLPRWFSSTIFKLETWTFQGNNQRKEFLNLDFLSSSGMGVLPLLAAWDSTGTHSGAGGGFPAGCDMLASSCHWVGNDGFLDLTLGIKNTLWFSPTDQDLDVSGG
jgi:hypothetical protein